MGDKADDLLTPEEKAFLDALREAFVRLPPKAQDDIAAAGLQVKPPKIFIKLLKATGDLGLVVPAQHQAAYADLKTKDAERKKAISDGHKKRKQAEDAAEQVDDRTPKSPSEKPPLEKSPLEKLMEMAPPDPGDHAMATPAVTSTAGQTAPRSMQAWGSNQQTRPATKPPEESAPLLRPVPPKSTT